MSVLGSRPQLSFGEKPLYPDTLLQQYPVRTKVLPPALAQP